MSHRYLILCALALLVSAPVHAAEPRASVLDFDPAVTLTTRPDAVDLGAYAAPPVAYHEGDTTHLSSDGVRTDDGHTEPGVHDHDHAPGPGGYVYVGSRADGHAPIGVMGDHAHGAGEWMLSYRYMRMHMDGNRDGDSRVGDADVRADGFMVVPTEMDMEMHMFGAMYAPTDDVTLMVMVPYLRNVMEHSAGAPLGSVKFKTSSEGLGDIKFGGMFPIVRRGHHVFQVNLSVSFPTGSITEKDRTPMGRVRLPYPMQLGSGTFDLLPAVVYTYQADHWSFGGQAGGVIRLGRNSASYSLGDRFHVTGWVAYAPVKWISGSARLNYEWWGDIDGRDGSFPFNGGTGEYVAPTMDPDRRSGQRLDLLFGINLFIPDGPLAGHRLAIEGGMPLYQYLDGPQLETDWILTAGWQFAW